MNIIKAGFVIEGRSELRGGISNIERAGRTCYKSEDKAESGSADRFVRAIINNRHEAMLEHGDYIFMVDEQVWNFTHEALMQAEKISGVRPMVQMTNVNKRPIVSGNIRAWRDLMRNTVAGQYFSGHIDPIYTFDIREKMGECFESIPDEHVRRIFYEDLRGHAEKLTHLRQTVRFTVDRGVSHELVRHRLFSFAQESTRYCNYSKGKFGNAITVIEPCYLKQGTPQYDSWRGACAYAENAYFMMLEERCSPQEARAVLPNSLKTEVVVTGNLREWRHFFALRARQVTGPAHPQMAEVAIPLYEADKKLYPDVFRD